MSSSPVASQSAPGASPRREKFNSPLLDSLTTYSRVHGNHSKRVQALAVRFGRALSLPREELEALSYGAALHDIGKLLIRLEVLEAPRRLDEEEWAHMTTHSALGADLLRAHGFGDAVVLAVRHHHERFDGGGYPDKLAGEDIPQLARIVTIVDSMDTMLSMRQYSQPRTFDDAAAELIRCSGTQFDLRLATEYVKVMRDRRGGGDSGGGQAGAQLLVGGDGAGDSKSGLMLIN